MFDRSFIDSTFDVCNLQLFDRKVILICLQLVLHSKQSIVYILR